MTDRDRLIELLRQGEQNTPCEKDEYRSCAVTNCDACVCEGIADYLLANGVIVPPCKVGDKVYMITPNGNIRNLNILSIDIELEKEVKMTCLAVYEFEGKPCYIQIHSFKFGKTVFLTKEEAEKKLKELKNNGL